MIHNKKLNASELIEYYQSLVKKYPIKSLEDPVFEDDWATWTNLTSLLGKDSDSW